MIDGRCVSQISTSVFLPMTNAASRFMKYPEHFILSPLHESRAESVLDSTTSYSVDILYTIVHGHVDPFDLGNMYRISPE